MADVAAPQAPADGGQGGSGGDPPQQPNKGGDKGKKNRWEGPKCPHCGNFAHVGPCWRPCRYCGRRHNFKRPCPRGALPTLESRVGIPTYNLSSSFAGRGDGGDGDVVGLLVQAGNAFASAANILLQRHSIKAGVQGVVGGGRVTSGRVQMTASEQDSKKPPVPPGGTPEQPADGPKRKRQRRQKTKKQSNDQNPADQKDGDQAEGGEGGDGPDHLMGG
ncbi:MAG: hypothetical protein L6R42_001217 [Xanthoria sp. 1 TBL-2021]|nr:MAG: hypothetical protein L6R42_001217 [Xanthoria sp. 1 TBL-2021]